MAVFLEFFTLTRTFRTIRTIRTIRTARTIHDRVRVRENCVFQAVCEVFHRFVGAVTRTHTTVPPVLRQFHPATIPPFCPNRPHGTAPFHRFFGAVTRPSPPPFHRFSGASPGHHPPLCPKRPKRPKCPKCPKCPNRPHGHCTVPPILRCRHPSFPHTVPPVLRCRHPHSPLRPIGSPVPSPAPAATKKPLQPFGSRGFEKQLLS